MQDLLTTLDALQLAYHVAHHSARGPAYFGDHAFFGESYLAAQSQFDALFERAQMLGLEPDEVAIARGAVDRVATSTLSRLDSVNAFFIGLSSMEEQLCEEIEREEPENSTGTRTLLGDISSASEARQGHLKRRLKTEVAQEPDQEPAEIQPESTSNL